ncbi:hypothetical protein HAX54_009021 [Datura stramonium]|uniref:Uncharacterized protein n=1 Tax=Datura stramonium TaxID=4076 RepID=A0ABS8TFL8_DATST|nr:hypothetical protein [Datura stramonium]
MWVNTSSIDNEENQRRKESPLGSVTTQEEFDFFSCGGSFSTNSTMCTADEVFFQGQILPLGHSNCLPSDSYDAVATGGDTCNEVSSTEYSSSENYTLQIRRESMEHCHQSVGITNSSINSSITCSSYKPQILSQFHSQPSPTPQARLFSKFTHRNINSSNRKSTTWSLFRVGLVTTPEIALQDLKIRCNKNFDTAQNNSSNDKRLRSLQRKRAFLGSCKCSVETVQSKVVTINRGSTNCKEVKKETKQKMSRRPTFEGLKAET